MIFILHNHYVLIAHTAQTVSTSGGYDIIVKHRQHSIMWICSLYKVSAKLYL